MKWSNSEFTVVIEDISFMKVIKKKWVGFMDGQQLLPVIKIEFKNGTSKNVHFYTFSEADEAYRAINVKMDYNEKAKT